MLQKSDIANPFDDHDWDNRVLSAKNYSFFHSASWARVLCESYGYRPLYFTWTSTGRIQALIPCMEITSLFTGKRAVSLPFTDYCEPILEDEFSNETFHPLMHKLIAYGKNAAWESIELRPGISLSREFVSSRTYYGHTLDISK